MKVYPIRDRGDDSYARGLLLLVWVVEDLAALREVPGGEVVCGAGNGGEERLGSAGTRRGMMQRKRKMICWC